MSIPPGFSYFSDAGSKYVYTVLNDTHLYTWHDKLPLDVDDLPTWCISDKIWDEFNTFFIPLEIL